MSILNKTTNMELTQFNGDILSFSNLYSIYNSDMLKIENYCSGIESRIDSRLTAMEEDIEEFESRVTAEFNTLDTKVDGYEDRITTLETCCENVNETITEYGTRLDAIELVIDTVSTQNIDDLVQRIDALEQKVDANTNNIDTLNTNLIEAVNRINELTAGLDNTNTALNALTVRVSTLETCCDDVRTTLADHNTRINANATDISALDARLTRDETNIAGNASDITILATQNNTQANQIQDLYERIANVDPSLVETESITDKGLDIDFTKKCGWVYVNISGTLTADIVDDTAWSETIPTGFEPMFDVSSTPNFPTDITNSLLSIVMLDDGTIKGMTANSVTIQTGESVNCKLVYPCV